MPLGGVMVKGSIATASVVVAFVATLGTFIVAIAHSFGLSDGAVNSIAGLAVASAAFAGWAAIRPEKTPPVVATPEVSLQRWVQTTCAVSLQITGAGVWLAAGGPWPPALTALSVGTGLLTARQLPPVKPQIVDLREARTIALVPGLESPAELAALAEQAAQATSAEEARRLRDRARDGEESSSDQGPIVLTSRQLLP